MTLHTTAAGIYRALMEALCFGARTVLDLFEADDFTVERVVMTSGLARNNPVLIQMMADVLGRTIDVPMIENATAVGAAIHGAVAGGRLVSGYPAGAERFGAQSSRPYHPRSRRGRLLPRPIRRVSRIVQRGVAAPHDEASGRHSESAGGSRRGSVTSARTSCREARRGRVRSPGFFREG